MIDLITISLIVGIVTFVVEQIFYIVCKVHKSKCCRNEVEFNKSP
jgi:hypothetical protein